MEELQEYMRIKEEIIDMQKVLLCNKEKLIKKLIDLKRFDLLNFNLTRVRREEKNFKKHFKTF